LTVVTVQLASCLGNDCHIDATRITVEWISAPADALLIAIQHIPVSPRSADICSSPIRRLHVAHLAQNIFAASLVASLAVPGGVSLAAQDKYSLKVPDGLSFEAPFAVNVPDKYQDIFFIEKDSKRFHKTSGWGYARFVYAPGSDSFSPDGKGSDCGYACHTKVAAKDYIFHPYQKL
jgi:hypothetical protein